MMAAGPTENSRLLASDGDSDKDSFVATNVSSLYSSDEENPSGQPLPTVDIEFMEPLRLERRRPRRDKKPAILKNIDETAFQFAFRMAVLLTVSALFVLVHNQEFHFPDAMWVLVSVLFVSWFPQLDAASVIEKITQRLIGTFLGAFLGLSCGFVSLLLAENYLAQATFLAVCVFLFNFLIIFLAGQCRLGEVKVIKRFNYATILCVLTFCICIMPFCLDEDPKWGRATWRVLNVVIGCALGALGSITIVPKSTTDVLYTKAYRQVSMAGEAAEAILKVSSDYLSGRVEINRLADELLKAPLETELRWKLARSGSISSKSSKLSMDMGATDVALKKYEDAIADWRLSKMLFPLTKYDPFKFRFNQEEVEIQDPFHTEIARTLARCLRIQTTIVVLDGMVRSDAEYNFSDAQLESFSQTGRLIRQMLKLPLDTQRSKRAARSLFTKLDETRRAIHNVSVAVANIEKVHDPYRFEGMQLFERDLLSDDDNSGFDSSSHDGDADAMGRGIPLNATSTNDNTLFFLQLVEHLILRSMRLYQAWKLVEFIRDEGYKR